MPWVYHDAARDKETTDEIDRQGDRAAAIIAAAFFEDRLVLAIKERLIRDAPISGALFKGTGALASFAAKIDFAYLLGIIDKHQRKSLHIIRNIRNEFAHNLSPLDFNSQNIKAKCENVYLIDNTTSVMKCIAVMQSQNKKTQFILHLAPWFARLKTLGDNPREIYIQTLQIILLQIEIMAGQSRLVSSLLAPWLNKSEPHSPPVPRSESRIRKKRIRPRRSPPA